MSIYLEELKIRELPKIARTYRNSFPVKERKPFSVMLKMRREGRQEMLVIHDAATKKAVGLCFMLTDGKNFILDYLAVDGKLRSKGYGGQTLSQIKKRYGGARIIIEIEKPVKSGTQAARRKEFYLRNGLKDSGINILLFGVEMELLYFGEEISYPFYEELLTGAFGKERKAFVKKNVKELK